MKRRRLFAFILLATVALLFAIGYLSVATARQVNLAGMLGSGSRSQLRVPPGFQVEVFAQGLREPRFIAFGNGGGLYVAERGADRIIYLPDSDGNGRADGIRVFASDVPSPHSLVQHEGAWFVGVPTGIIRFDDQDQDGTAESRQALVSDYPASGHNTRTVLFLPDGRMVVSVGSSCNVCLEEDPRRAAILVYDGPSAKQEGIFASGLRNAVGLALQPSTGELWASNNGRDLMGDDLPPDTIELIREGEDYGWPRCHSGRILDPRFGEAGSCEGIAKPQVELQAHSAPLGLAFYQAEGFPQEFQGDLFVAFHGSWNRSLPTGYKVVRIPFEQGRPAGEVEDFIVGWLDPETGEVSGRPVGLAIGADGSLFVSDDKAGLIYRVSYSND